MKNITILGSTGSVGCNTLRVIAQHPEKFSVYALTAHSNAELLLQQCCLFKPKLAVLTEASAAHQLALRLHAANINCEVLVGEAGLVTAATATEVDFVMAAIVGAIGLTPTLMAVRAGKRILLANKEVLVMAGQVFMQAVHLHKAELLPIDSEHNAIFQCLPRYSSTRPESAISVQKIILTASGGPFLTTPLTALKQVSSVQACAHPNWKMGKKISVDSATMMNKALEVIEAHHLFNLSASQIEVLVHPQSIVHSMVQYVDGAVLAEMANADMRVPIAYALAWPERMTSGAADLSLVNRHLDFFSIEQLRFPCLSLAYQALQAQGTSSTILNAANEVAVAAFLAHKIAFTDIYRIVAETLMTVAQHPAIQLEQILADDASARQFANSYIIALQKHNVTRYTTAYITPKVNN